jgi:hypothetical protein
MVLAERPWAPARDDELWWFRPGSILPARPRPLEFTLDVRALTFALTRGLVSLNFPLYEIRGRLIEGELYLASVPSGLWELDPTAKTQLLWDASLRFTRSIRAPWEREVGREVESYNGWLAEAGAAGASDSELAQRWRRLRRVRGNQWYAMIRAVVGPLAMLQRRLADLPADSPDRPGVAAIADEGTVILQDALGLVRQQGSALTETVVALTAGRLVDAGRLATADDIRWLEWGEAREALTAAGDWQERVAQRQAAARAAPSPAPETVGPPLAPDAWHMYLVREVLALLAA